MTVWKQTPEAMTVFFHNEMIVYPEYRDLALPASRVYHKRWPHQALGIDRPFRPVSTIPQILPSVPRWSLALFRLQPSKCSPFSRAKFSDTGVGRENCIMGRCKRMDCICAGFGCDVKVTVQRCKIIITRTP